MAERRAAVSTRNDLTEILTKRHEDAVAVDEWGPHGFADDWQSCPACTDIPHSNPFAGMIRSYWRAVDVTEGRL